MSSAPTPALQGTALFDQLVAHEAGSGANTAGSLRPKLPYPFHALALEEAAPEVIPPLGGPDAVAAIEQRAPARREAAPAMPTATPAQAGSAPAPPTPAQARPGHAPGQRVVRDAVLAPSRNNEPMANASMPAEARASERAPVAAAAVAAAATSKARARPQQPALAPAQRDQTSPAALTPLRPRLPPSPERAALRAAPRLPAASPASEPTIEIRIGRIDVRAAVQPELAPSPGRPADPPADRLGTYLGRRARGARS
jgi:hypothetical protein